MSTKPAVPAEPRPAPVEDIRSGRPYLLSRTTLLAVVRRLASVAALVTIDLAGLVLGVWVALIFRELYLGDWPPLWGIVWETESEWLPFLTVITVLVFWVGGLYRRRELRAGVGQIVLSMVLVALITLAFGLGTGYHFTTYGWRRRRLSRRRSSSGSFVRATKDPDEEHHRDDCRRRQAVGREVVAGAKAERERDQGHEHHREHELADGPHVAHAEGRDRPPRTRAP